MRTSLVPQDKALSGPACPPVWAVILLGFGLVAGCSDETAPPSAGPASSKPAQVAAGPTGADSAPASPSAAPAPTPPDAAGEASPGPSPQREPNPFDDGKPAIAKAPLAAEPKADRPAVPKAGPAHDTETVAAGAAEPAKKAELRTEPAKKAEEAPSMPKEAPATKPVDLGQPLVEQPETLIRADIVHPVWYDRNHKRVVILGRTCRPSILLEYFVSKPEKAYESVIEVEMNAFVVHAGLLAFGVEPGHPVQWDPQYSPPSGPKIDIEVRWKDKDQKVHSAKAQDWIRNVKTKKKLDEDFVFTGSGFWMDDTTGRRHYQAEGGDFISVLNLPSSMIDLPVRSPSDPDSRIFEVNTDVMPPPGTPVTVLLGAKKS